MNYMLYDFLIFPSLRSSRVVSLIFPSFLVQSSYSKNKPFETLDNRKSLIQHLPHSFILLIIFQSSFYYLILILHIFLKCKSKLNKIVLLNILDKYHFSFISHQFS